jgi:hypothetical protein
MDRHHASVASDLVFGCARIKPALTVSCTTCAYVVELEQSFYCAPLSRASLAFQDVLCEFMHCGYLGQGAAPHGCLEIALMHLFSHNMLTVLATAPCKWRLSLMLCMVTCFVGVPVHRVTLCASTKQHGATGLHQKTPLVFGHAMQWTTAL